MVEVESFTVHRQFGPNKLNYDIGVIRLARHADMSKDTIKPICLPITRTLNEKTFEDVNLLENEQGKQGDCKFKLLIYEFMFKNNF